MRFLSAGPRTLAAFATLLLAGIQVVPAAGALWTPVAEPEDLANIELFLAASDAIYAGTGAGNVFGSLDHGDTWGLIGSEFSDLYAPVQAMVIAGDTFIMSRAAFDTTNFRSHFDGQAWSPWEPLDYQDSPLASMAVIGQTLFAVLSGGIVQRSEDHAMTWTPVTPPGLQPIWKVFAHQGHLFASNDQINTGQIYRSDDLGQSWVEVDQGLGSSYICSHITWQGRLLLCVYHYGGVGTFWSSADLGNSWGQITTLPTTYNINGMAVAQDGRLAIGAASGYPDHQSIWLSSNLVDWENYTGDLPQASWPFDDLVSQGGWFFKTGGTVTCYRALQPLVSAVDDRTPSRSDMALSAYPNPLNPQTTVRFSLPATEWVNLSVFDPKGRLVATLHQGTLSAGEHQFSWPGRDQTGRILPSGTYLARLSNASGPSCGQKLLLVK